jgi:hypothetical protein
MTTEQRLVRLERENRWMRRIGAVAVAVAAAVFLIGQEKANPLPDLRARSLSLIDDNGKQWLFAGSKDGAPSSLSLWDASSGRLWFFAGYMGTKEEPGTPSVQLHPAKEGGFLELIAAEDRIGMFVHDADWGVRAAAYIDADETPRIAVQEKGAKGWVALKMLASGKGPFLEIRGPDGKVLFEVPSK